MGISSIEGNLQPAIGLIRSTCRYNSIYDRIAGEGTLFLLPRFCSVNNRTTIYANVTLSEGKLFFLNSSESSFFSNLLICDFLRNNLTRLLFNRMLLNRLLFSRLLLDNH